MASKYAAVHDSPEGPGDARPTAMQIIQDEGLEGKLKGKTFLITGCSSGIGVETARAIAATGATVYCTVRDIEKGKTALAGILEPGCVELLELDLSSLATVRTAAAEFLSKTAHKPLNVLICNAGLMAIPTLTTTVDGFETQFATNHLAHFLLINLLKPSLLASSTPEFNSRVVIVASSAHAFGTGVRFDDLGFKNGDYTPFGAYGQSKTAEIYTALYIDRRLGPKGLHATSLHPGSIWTPLQRHVSEEDLEGWKSMEDLAKMVKSTEQGAATTVWAAVGKVWEGKGGKYLDNCQICQPAKEGDMPGSSGFADWIYDEEKQDRLWTESLKMVGLE